MPRRAIPCLAAALLALLSSHNASARPRHATAALATGLVSWWQAEGNNNDAVSNHNGIRTGSDFVPARIGTGYDIETPLDQVLIADDADFQLTSVSISAWINLRSYPAASPGIGQILFRGDNRGSLDPYYLAVLSNGQLRFHVESATAFVDLEAPVPVAEWVHVAGTLDAATGTMRLYENGLPVAETTTNVRPFLALDGNSNPGLAIGNTEDTFAFAEPLPGVVDEVQLCNRALREPEVAWLALAGANQRRGRAVEVSLAGGSINPASTKPRTLAVLATSTFDLVRELDRGSVSIGRIGYEQKARFLRVSDANHDGLRDLLFTFAPRSAHFQPGDVSAVLVGQTKAHVVVVGSAPITVNQ